MAGLLRFFKKTNFCNLFVGSKKVAQKLYLNAATIM
jgi:hypothetical protein